MNRQQSVEKPGVRVKLRYMENETAASPEESNGLSEDWVVFGPAFVLIALGLVFPHLSLPKFSWTPDSVGKVLSAENISLSLSVGAAFLLLSSVGVRLLGGSVARYAAGFPIVFVLAWASKFLAGNAMAKEWGISYVIFALFIGMLIGNVFPDRFREAIRTEYYIKIGLIILGSGILFGKILSAGLSGILQALFVVLVIWYACYWICRRLAVDSEFAAILSTAVSICGVSAAIAACGAIGGDRKKLSYVTSLVLIVAVPMMLIMPWAVEHFQIPAVVGGAWIGGTIDTTGAVVAAGELVGESAMNAAVVVKFSQNAMLGLAAFALSVWWTFRQGADEGIKPSARVIWERFPKFILGFMAASLLFSFVVGDDLVSQTKGLMKELRGWWFALAFVCIGLETHFSTLISMEEGRPAYAFLIAQGMNVIWTLIVAWLLFGGLLFPAPVL